jgi:hypothetical protein
MPAAAFPGRTPANVGLVSEASTRCGSLAHGILSHELMLPRLQVFADYRMNGPAKPQASAREPSANVSDITAKAWPTYATRGRRASEGLRRAYTPASRSRPSFASHRQPLVGVRKPLGLNKISPCPLGEARYHALQLYPFRFRRRYLGSQCDPHFFLGSALAKLPWSAPARGAVRFSKAFNGEFLRLL